MPGKGKVFLMINVSSRIRTRHHVGKRPHTAIYLHGFDPGTSRMLFDGFEPRITPFVYRKPFPGQRVTPGKFLRNLRGSNHLRSLSKRKRHLRWRFLFGRGTRIRTQDTRFWRPLLYQLSYAPMREIVYHILSAFARANAKNFLFYRKNDRSTVRTIKKPKLNAEKTPI